jgi:hypothetical protein
MDDILARAACDFKDDASHRQDIENEIAIPQCRRRILAAVAPIPPHAFLELRP